MSSKFLPVLSLIAAIGGAGASAATTTFTSEATFLAAIGGDPTSFIDFETGFTDNQAIDGVNLGGLTLNEQFASANPRIEDDSISGSNPVGVFSVEINSGNGNVVELAFDAPVDYVGLKYIDAGTPNIGGFDFPNTDANGDTALFAGLIFDSAVSSVLISSVQGDSTWGLDDIAFGQIAPVPGPASLPLVLSGGLVLGWLRRRRSV